MKHLKVFESFRSGISNDFVDYMIGFYGPNEIWGNFFNDNLTRDIVEKYVDSFIKKRGHDFEGDSFDREMYRDILLVRMGISDINEVELNVKSFFTESELKKAELLYQANKYNL